MDIIDIQIIKLLQKNARISISEISNQVNLSVSAISERLKKLEGGDLIQQYTTILNAKALEKDLTVFMYITLERSQFNEEFTKYIDQEDEIIECHYIAGNYDCCLKIITENTSSLERIFNNIKSLPGVNKTQTNVVLSTTKNLYSVTPNLEN